jgi:hypothetical protein
MYGRGSKAAKQAVYRGRLAANGFVQVTFTLDAEVAKILRGLSSHYCKTQGAMVGLAIKLLIRESRNLSDDSQDQVNHYFPLDAASKSDSVALGGSTISFDYLQNLVRL